MRVVARGDLACQYRHHIREATRSYTNVEPIWWVSTEEAVHPGVQLSSESLIDLNGSQVHHNVVEPMLCPDPFDGGTPSRIPEGITVLT
jgi:hypothetical protein